MFSHSLYTLEFADGCVDYFPRFAITNSDRMNLLFTSSLGTHVQASLEDSRMGTAKSLSWSIFHH